jgi:sulfoxide reductase heme-binding subunit YedZ
MAAFLMLLPLALTSTDRAIRRLGPQAWARLHRLAYPATLLGGLHFLMSLKAWQTGPALYMGAILVLLVLRLVPRRRASGLAQAHPRV